MHTWVLVMSAVAVVVHQFDEALQGLEEETELLEVRPEGVVEEDGVDVVGDGVAPLLKAFTHRDPLENRPEEQKALDEVVDAGEAGLAVDDDAVGLSVRLY